MRLASWCVLGAVLSFGCNAILGNDEGQPRSSNEGGAGAMPDASGDRRDVSAPNDTSVPSDTSVPTDSTPIDDASDAASLPDVTVVGDAGCNPDAQPTCAGRAQNIVLSCDPTSHTIVSRACDGTKLCDASSGPNQGTCQEPAAGCAGKNPGDKFCSAKQSVTCGPDLVTSTSETCAFVCIANGQCAACMPGDKQCSGNGYQTCQANGTWGATVACPAACIGAGVCGTCTPTEKGCSGNGVQTCQANGTWGAATPCPFVCTGAGMCSGECVPGAKQCSGNSTQTCGSNGLWGAANACMYVCSGLGVCGGECVPNTKKCTGNGVQTCTSSGVWGAAVACQFACTGLGVCSGTCVPGSTQCSGNGVRTCASNGTLGAVVACAAATPVCNAGACGVPPSCGALANNCGSPPTGGCCLSTLVPGGTFNRANDAMYPATVSDFRMDNYEVTVGRFRKFVAGYPQNKPGQNDGRNPNNPSDIGWDTTWNSQLPTDAASLRLQVSCGDATQHNWSDAVGSRENRAMNCIDWYLAQAFCIWDGGRLPTEAEWNYAAAGGSQQRVYPWSNPPADTTIDDTYASYYGNNGCNGDGVSTCTATLDVLVVGSKPKGNGRWTHSDLGGNVSEWLADWFFQLSNPCTNCTNGQPSNGWRPLHGGGYNSADYYLVTSFRQEPLGTGDSGGMRCVRLP